MLRHERQTVAMELAAALHPSLGGGLGMNVGLRAQNTASAGPAEYFDLFSGDGRPAGGERPAALLEPRPQPGVLRHTLEHVVEICPYVPILDVRVPQMGDQVVEVLRRFDVTAVEQVIAVPKIFLDRVTQRSAVRYRRQNSWWKCRRSQDMHWRSMPCRPWG